MAIQKRDDKKCYTKNNGGAPQERSDYTPCSGALVDNNQCCGKDDQCMPSVNGAYICYSPNNNTANHISYYAAGCTDSNFKGDGCMDACANEKYDAIKWQPNRNLWGCCGTGNVGQVDCNQDIKETFNGPSQDFLDNWRSLHDAGQDVKTLAKGAIAGIAIGGALFLAAVIFLLWRCCCSKSARDKKNRGNFVPIGKTRGAENVWDANMPHNDHELHQGPAGSYGYGGQGAPYNPPHQATPQYTVANFR